MPRVLSTQLLALSTQTVVCSCPLHPRPCLTPVYTFAWSQSCHVFFPFQLLALSNRTVLCSCALHPRQMPCLTSHSRLHLCHVPVIPRVLSTQLLALFSQTVFCSCPPHPRQMPCLTPHSCLHLCHVSVMPRVLSSPAVGLVQPDQVLCSCPPHPRHMPCLTPHSRIHLSHVPVMPRVLLALFSQTGSCVLTCPDRLTGSVHRPAGSALCRSPGEMTAGRAQWGGSWNESARQWEQGMSN